MQKIKNILMIVLALLLALLFSNTYFPPGQTSGNITGQNTPLQYKDAAGTVHTEVKPAQVVSMNELKAHDRHIIDSMLHALRAKQSAVTDITTAELKTEGNFIPEYYTDSNLYYSTYVPVKFNRDSQLTIHPQIKYADKWISLYGTIAKDSALHYTIYDAISAVAYEKKIGLFKYEYVVDVSSINPHSKISGLYAVRLKQKPKTWGLGITAGYVYDGISFRPGISLGITKTIIRW